jgi:hypothetical protein
MRMAGRVGGNTGKMNKRNRGRLGEGVDKANGYSTGERRSATSGITIPPPDTPAILASTMFSRLVIVKAPSIKGVLRWL